MSMLSEKALEPLPDWNGYLDRLRPLPERAGGAASAGSDDLRQEYYARFLAMLSQGYLLLLDSDPDHPRWAPLLNFAYRAGAANPEAVYYQAIIDGKGVYRIAGDRGSGVVVTITIQTGVWGVTNAVPKLLADLDIDQFEIAADGQFELILSAERPVGYTGNWSPLDPSAASLTLRDISLDWGRDRSARLSIERLDVSAVARRQPRDPRELQRRINELIAYAEGVMRWGYEHHLDDLHARGIVNKVEIFSYASISAVMMQSYYSGAFELRDDEVILIETDIPRHFKYWNVQLVDPYWYAVDYGRYQSSLNNRLARIDADGRFRAVIAARDPGVANWLDTAGYLSGAINGRWNQADSAPLPVLTKLPLSQLWNHLPAGTPRISAAEREASLRERQRGEQMRRHW